MHEPSFVIFYNQTQSSWACHNWMMSRNQGLNVFWRQQKPLKVHIIEEAAPPPKWQVPKSQDILLT